MKSCPTCNRTFEDSFSFCLVDGSILSAPFDSEDTLALPHARSTDPSTTEVMPTPTEARREPVPATIPSPLPPPEEPTPIKTITVAANQLPRQPDQPPEHKKSKHWLLNPRVYLPLILIAALAVFLTWNSLRDSAPTSSDKNKIRSPASQSETTTKKGSPREQTLSGHTAEVYSVSFSPDGLLLACGSSEGASEGKAFISELKLWDTQTGEVKRSVTEHSEGVVSVAFSPDGSLLATATGSVVEKENRSGRVKLRDAQTLELKWAVPAHKDFAMSVSFSPNGKLLASGSWDRTIKLWDVQGGTLQRTIVEEETVYSIAFSPDGQTLASAGANETVNLWETETGRLKLKLAGKKALTVAFSPDGRLLASGSPDKMVRIWDAQTGALVRTLKGHKDWVWSVAFSPDSKTLASGSTDNTVKLWDVQTGSLKRTLQGHTDQVRSVAFSPDGKILASGSLDKTVRLQNVQS